MQELIDAFYVVKELVLPVCALHIIAFGATWNTIVYVVSFVRIYSVYSIVVE